MDAVPVLCLLGILCSLALAIDTTVPPEDIDGSGDDEDFSGFSGSDGDFVDLESKDVIVFSTSISTLVPTVEGSTAAQEPEIIDKEATEVEATTTSSETTKTHEDIIEDLFAVDKEVTTHEATTPPSQHTSTANLVEENDTKKHHHHHHHPHHHTTTSSPSSTSESDGQDNSTKDTPLEVGEPIDIPEETTTSTPDVESELDHVPLGLTTPVVDLSEHGGLLEETTSGSTSTYPDNDEAHVEPLDADNLPELDSSVTTTVVSDSHTSHHPHHHHHPHLHHHHNPTTSSVGEADVQQEVTTSPSELVEPEDNVQEAEHTTPLTDDEFPLHGHPHHETTPSSTMPTEPEKPHEVHTHEPKGRKVHVPDVRSTTAIPVINEEEHIPEDSETDDSPSATVYYNVSRNPFDENEISDSKEEGPSGVDEDIFFEVTVPSVNRMNNEDSITDDGTSNASHGIMERKELLAGIIAGGVAGLVFAAFLVAFVLYRMKKKDEGSYSLEEPKQSNGGYQKPREQREFYA